MSLIGFLQGNPGGLSSSNNTGQLISQQTALSSTNPNILRTYLAHAKTNNAATNAATAQALAGNKSGVSYQEIAGALGITDGGNQSPAPGGDLTGTGTATPTGGTSTADAQAAAQELAAIQSQLDRLPNQTDIGKQNILDAYQAAYNTLTNQQGQAARDFGTNKDQTVQDNVAAKTAIDTGVNQTLTGAQRLLGSRGAGNSSAATVAAPYAAGQAGAAQRGEVQNTFGRNMGALDTANNDANEQFTEAFGSLGAQRDNNLATLQQKADEARANLLLLKGGADPTTAADVNNLGSQIDSLGATTTYTPPVINYAAPNLATYTPTPAAAPTIGTGPVAPSAAQAISPYFTLLTNPKDKDKTLLPAAA